MFEEADSLGVSQGQGRGFAQVFDSTYNPVFKEETARLIKEDKEGKAKIEKDISGLDATVWKKAQPALREKLDDLYLFTMQNHRNINKGNTPEKLEYQKKISDIQLFTKEQKLQEDLWIKQFNNVALKKGVYAPEALDILQNYFEDPNLTDPRYIADLPLSFDPINHKLKVVAPMVQKIVEPYTLKPGFKDDKGNIIYDKVWETAGPEIEKQMKDNWKALPDSAKSFFETEENYISLANSFREVGAQRNVKQPYVDPKQKQQQKLDIIINNNSEEDISIPYGEEGSKNKIFRKGKSVAVHEVAGNFNETVNLRPSEIKGMRGIPIGVFGIYQGKDGNISDDYFEGDFWTKVGDQAALTFKPKKVRSMARFTPQLDSQGNPLDTKNFRKNVDGEIEVFASTASGGKKWIPIENISIDKNDIKNGSFRGVKLNDDNASWEPYLIGNYKKKLGDKQTNFDIAIPYNEYKGFVGADPKSGNEIKNFEAVVNEKDSEVLQKKTFTRGKEIAGIKQEPEKILIDKVKRTDGTTYLRLRKTDSLLQNYKKQDIEDYEEYLNDPKKDPNKTIPFLQFIKL